MLEQITDGRGYTRNHILPRSGRPVTIRENETFELDIQTRDVEHNGMLVQIVQKIHTPEEIEALCNGVIDARD